jgi:fructose-1-phosphate kinase PfkB-like protein
MILTVTLNPALDRTMTVPNFQAGFRHRATDTITLPGGKGINVARAAKALGRPVIATGFIGGRKGDQIVAGLNSEGILCDFVPVAGESRISTAVVDSATNGVTEITEQGPEIRPDELSLMYEKSGGCGGVRRQRSPGAR